MPSTTFTAAAPDGTTVSRTSASRTYSHALLVRRADGTWGAFGWIGRPDLVAAKMREAERYGRKPGDMHVAPAVAKAKASKPRGFCNNCQRARAAVTGGGCGTCGHPLTGLVA